MSFTETIYLFIPIIFPKFFGKNFNRSLGFGNENFLKLIKKIGNIPLMKL